MRKVDTGFALLWLWISAPKESLVPDQFRYQTLAVVGGQKRKGKTKAKKVPHDAKRESPAPERETEGEVLPHPGRVF
jgi:hypothetical protein